MEIGDLLIVDKNHSYFNLGDIISISDIYKDDTGSSNLNIKYSIINRNSNNTYICKAHPFFNLCTRKLSINEFRLFKLNRIKKRINESNLY